MRSLIVVVGSVALLIGLLWIGQGMGIVRWPSTSFMIDQRGWSMAGAGLAAVGVALILLARRVGRR